MVVVGEARPGLKVSGQITGIRQDAWVKANSIQVEEEKAGEERGHHIHPQLFGQPEDFNNEWARHPEMIRTGFITIAK